MKKVKLSDAAVIVAIAVLITVLFISCADREIVAKCVSGHTYGFWGGLWHGIIAPFDLIGMLIRDNITMYAENNNGGWYAFGFLLGSGGWGILAGSRGRKKVK
jgi:hypothetical protein